MRVANSCLTCVCGKQVPDVRRYGARAASVSCAVDGMHVSHTTLSHLSLPQLSPVVLPTPYLFSHSFRPLPGRETREAWPCKAVTESRYSTSVSRGDVK